MIATGDDMLNSYHLSNPLPLWLNSAYAKHIVKGNFMTLSARPKTVEQGEWIAHQGLSSRRFRSRFDSDQSSQLSSTSGTCGTSSA